MRIECSFHVKVDAFVDILTLYSLELQETS
jgi:hypothetical protein